MCIPADLRSRGGWPAGSHLLAQIDNFQHQDGGHLCSMLSTTTRLEDDVGQGAAELSSIELSLLTSKP